MNFGVRTKNAWTLQLNDHGRATARVRNLQGLRHAAHLVGRVTSTRANIVVAPSWPGLCPVVIPTLRVRGAYPSVHPSKNKILPFSGFAIDGCSNTPIWCRQIRHVQTFEDQAVWFDQVSISTSSRQVRIRACTTSARRSQDVDRPPDIHPHRS